MLGDSLEGVQNLFFLLGGVLWFGSLISSSCITWQQGGTSCTKKIVRDFSKSYHTITASSSMPKKNNGISLAPPKLVEESNGS